jgi:hypothetical protein
VEQSVEQNFREALAMHCNAEKQTRSNRIYRVTFDSSAYEVNNLIITILKAQWGSQSDKDAAKAYPTPSCDEYEKYFMRRGRYDF